MSDDQPNWLGRDDALRELRGMSEPPCGFRTVRGNVCAQPRAASFPCCHNHIGHWCVDDAGRTLHVVRVFAGRVDRVWPRCGGTCGKREVGLEPEVQLHITVGRSHSVAVRMGLATARVAADLLEHLGDVAACEAILRAADAAVEEWPVRQKHTCGCTVFGCSRPEVMPRVGHCEKHSTPNETDWTCYPCRPGEDEDLAAHWLASGHRVAAEPLRHHRIRVWIKDDPEAQGSGLRLESFDPVAE